MKGVGKWQEVTVEFFVSEILPKYWNHEGGTKDRVLEFQYFPALYNGFHDKRVFIGECIKSESPYNDREDKVTDKILEELGIDALREYEERHALGLAMTGDGRYKVDCVSFSIENQIAYKMLLGNFGYSFPETEQTHNLFFWINKEGENYKPTADPEPDRIVRIRVIEKKTYEELIWWYKDHDYRFPSEFIKEDAVVE